MARRRHRRGAVFVRRAPDPERRRFATFWGDPERRRALLLSLLLHAGLLWSVLWVYLAPEPEPPEELIVLELTPPESAVSQQEAAADTDPAPQNPDTQVAGNAPETSQASLENAETAEAETTAEATTENPPVPAAPEPAPTEPALTEAPPETLAETEAPAPPSERPPQARPPAQVATPNLPTEAPASTLPEIEAVEVAPQPPQDAIALPAPNPEAAVTPSRRVAPTPQVTLSEAQTVPAPAVSAEVVTRDVTLPDVQTTVTAADAVPEPDVQVEVAADVPVPRVKTTVAAADAIPQPAVSAEVRTEEITLPRVQSEVMAADAIPQPAASAEVATEEITLPQVQSVVVDADAIPQPSVRAEVAAAVPQPQIQTEVAAATAVPQPSVQAEVAAATPVPEAAAAVAAAEAVPQPQAGAVVSAAQGVPQPAVSGAVVPAQEVPQPQVGTAVTEAQPLEAAPGVTLTDTVSVATPEVVATVAPGAVSQAAEAADAGDGARNLQPDAAATADAQGSAADGDGPADSGVTNVQSFEVTLEKPLAVLIDNADAAYPQQGLVEAQSVFEMPVEGGLTRLMSVYTKDDPAQVGPIRSARDYFLEAALAMNGTLVHVGGEPSSIDRIASRNLPTLDALQQGTLFAQASDRSEPHSTFSTGTALRDAVGRVENQVSGTLYTPSGDAPDAGSVTVNYSADYTSGFRYLPDLDRYRWVRSGADAGDAAGAAVATDAVIVAQIRAFPKSGDSEGRLYLTYSEGGAATLYLRGKAIPGSWTPAGGFSFQTQSGTVVDLTPFKRWILFAPESAGVSAN